MGRRRKFEILENIEITDAGAGGMAVGRYNDKVVFVPFAVPGDIADVFVTKSKSSYVEGRVERFRRFSSLRVEPVCSHFGVCGGCRWQNMDYSDQLRFKEKLVLDNLKRIGKVDTGKARPIIGSPEIWGYRNKLEYTFLNKKWLTREQLDDAGGQNMNGLGFHVPGRFDKILDISRCYLMEEPANALRDKVRRYALENGLTFFDVKTWNGLLRNMIIRCTEQGEWMVIMVFGYFDTSSVFGLMDYIHAEFQELASLYYVINEKRNDSLTGLDFILYKGNPCIYERMDGLVFRIGPQSFFQTNTKQALVLYRMVKDFACLTGKETVYDLYTGTGTIANFVAGQSSKVIGIESVAMAIEDAKENARQNNIANTRFFTGEIEKVLDDSFVQEQGRPDVVITDPPRAGMHEKVVGKLIEILPDRIVYISCNPATQARDIALMQEHYLVNEIQPVDMFPHTQHVENIVVMNRRSS